MARRIQPYVPLAIISVTVRRSSSVAPGSTTGNYAVDGAVVGSHQYRPRGQPQRDGIQPLPAALAPREREVAKLRTLRCTQYGQS